MMKMMMKKRLVKRQAFEAGIRQDEEWGAYQLRWPRYRYEIAGGPTGRVATIWRHRPAAVRAQVPSWPAGGVFVPWGKPSGYYNPVEVTAEILLDVQRTTGDDPNALLRFVNKWGVLGVGIPGDPHFYDGVVATRQWLTRFTEWIEALKAVQRGETARMTWVDLADLLNTLLGEIHPAARPSGRGLDPVYRVSRLVDALCLELWEMATDGKRLRRCPECRALFIPGRANQEYCTRQCANRPTVRRWKRKQKRIRMTQKGKRG